ncbi:hypothetical protein BGZ76_001635 [Entomortierella beljakovae]|nr:hypothetical protein BGZ76_001635 [Entomortierella beljakovae]
MVKIRKPTGPVLLGVPLTRELFLRIFLLLATIVALIVAAKPKVESILKQANVVGVTVSDEGSIKIPRALFCGIFTGVEVTGIRMTYYANKTLQETPVNLTGRADIYNVKPVSELHLNPFADWNANTVGASCVQFEPTNLMFVKNKTNPTDNDMDVITIVLSGDKPLNVTNVYPTGLYMTVWDGSEAASDGLNFKQPIVNSLPSVNVLTFTYSEHHNLNGNIQTRYAMTKQNLHPMAFGGNVYARIVLLPDTFYVTRYSDRLSYTWVDLAGAIGGMASIALAVWIFLFGSGKYKSWGIMQRYVLRTSPDSKRDRDLSFNKTTYDRTTDFFRRQLQRFNNDTENDLDNVPLQTAINERKQISTRYSMNVASAAALASGQGNGNEVHRTDSAYEPRYSVESQRLSTYYFSDRGAPGSLSLYPLAPVKDGDDDIEEQVSELIRLIDLRIDERMWSLEKTLARYYLDGFRLRNYSYQHVPQYQVRDLEAGGVDRPFETNRNYMENTSYSSGSNSIPSVPTSPSYPPRPQQNRQYEVIDEAPDSSRSLNDDTIAPVVASNSSNQPNSHLSSGFSVRRDMRGTIRRAVERLQNEWPQPHSPEPYVPRTQYQSPNSNNNNNNNTSINNNNTTSSSKDRNNEPPAY